MPSSLGVSRNFATHLFPYLPFNVCFTLVVCVCIDVHIYMWMFILELHFHYFVFHFVWIQYFVSAIVVVHCIFTSTFMIIFIVCL